MQKAEKMQALREFAAEIRVETLKTIGSLGFGHVGGSMSIADAMAVLYGDIMKIDPKNPRWEDRDWCVLSKGHAGPCAYATLGLKGFYPLEETRTLNKPPIRRRNTGTNQAAGTGHAGYLRSAQVSKVFSVYAQSGTAAQIGCAVCAGGRTKAAAA